MAKTDATELDDLAFRLYAERISKAPAQTNGEDVARWSYRKAEEFVAIRDRVRSGDAAAVIATSRLADVSAPRLKKTHPHNLVSQRFADDNGGEPKVLARIKEINQWLLSHPHEKKYEPLDWDEPTTNTARVLLPHYASN